MFYVHSFFCFSAGNYFASNQLYLAKGKIAPVVLLPDEAKWKYMILHWRIRTESDWWFSKIFRIRIGFNFIRTGLGLKNFTVRSSLMSSRQWFARVIFVKSESQALRVRAASESSKNFASRVERVMTWSSWVRLESQELSSHFESLVCKFESMSSQMKFHIFL